MAVVSPPSATPMVWSVCRMGASHQGVRQVWSRSRMKVARPSGKHRERDSEILTQAKDTPDADAVAVVSVGIATMEGRRRHRGEVVAGIASELEGLDVQRDVDGQPRAVRPVAPEGLARRIRAETRSSVDAVAPLGLSGPMSRISVESSEAQPLPDRSFPLLLRQQDITSPANP